MAAPTRSATADTMIMVVVDIVCLFVLIIEYAQSQSAPLPLHSEIVRAGFPVVYDGVGRRTGCHCPASSSSMSFSMSPSTSNTGAASLSLAALSALTSDLSITIAS